MGTAFFSLVTGTDASEGAPDWTCDRREFFDSHGELVFPERLGMRSGGGLDPCGALSIALDIAPGGTRECLFMVGYAPSEAAAASLAVTAAGKLAGLVKQEIDHQWDTLLGATTVTTPDPLFDAVVNRWLLYQTLSCRLWAKAGFYQAGGATGFRDQLQDSMAFSWAAPALLRQQIVLCASRQFVQGDVQHWWHDPGGVGVRTRFSDDLLWLPYAIAHYLKVTADVTVLDQMVQFIDGQQIPEGAEDAYFTPTQSGDLATVYEHAARTLDRSLPIGVHGLPLMGSGDWNDGMNRVGGQGRGESVWLGWFLCCIVEAFAPLARSRGEGARAAVWESAAQGWQRALVEAGWDGQWFRRAFFDDGQILGSAANAECRIDLIAQAWAVMTGCAPENLQVAALDALDTHLVDPEVGLLRLLTPPLQEALPSAGYIQTYPPGVRENGGQYAHAGVWAIMAQAKAHAQGLAPAGSGVSRGDLAYTYFTYLSPAHRAAHPGRGPVYGLEPYAMAGDVYSVAPYAGRGGWSWYTGAAGLMHRAAIESIFGLDQRARSLTLRPCLPSHWAQVDMTLARGGQHLHFRVLRASHERAVQAAQQWAAQLLQPGEELAWVDCPNESRFLVVLTDVPLSTFGAMAH
jgi:cyclic beta-1,2-glucan synthetase